MKLHAAFDEGFFDDGGGLVVLDGKDTGQHLDDGDFDAERVHDVGELHADGARAQNKQALGQAGQRQDASARKNGLFVELKSGKLARAAAGGDENVRGGDFLGAVDGQFVGAADDGGAGDDVDFILFKKIGRSLARGVGGGAAFELHLGVVETRNIDLDAHVGQQLDGVVGLSLVDERLRGNTAPVAADAAQFVLFDDGGLQPELRRADGGNIAAGTAADDDQIVGIRGHNHSFKTNSK